MLITEKTYLVKIKYMFVGRKKFQKIVWVKSNSINNLNYIEILL